MADAVAAIVEERAEGNPLFIEQLTYAMRDAGQIVVDAGLLRTASGIQSIDSAIIPDTVQRLITTRLDQLPAAESLTIKVASVIGQHFAVRTLGEIYPLPTSPDELTGHLRTLGRLGLVSPVPIANEPTFEFSHVITKEVAYNLMLSAQSRELHRDLALWYERTYADDLSPFHAVLATHWRKAGDAARAIDHLEAAGTQALRTFANTEAMGFFEQALALTDEARVSIAPPRLGRWRLQLGAANVNLSRYREGRGHLEIGLRLLKQASPAGGRQQVAALVGEILRQLAHRLGLGRHRPLTDDGRADVTAIMRAYLSLAEVSYYASETLLPLFCVIRHLNEGESWGIPGEIASGLAGTGALLGLVPLPSVAEWYLRRALERLGEVDELRTHEDVEIAAGFYYIGAAAWQPARDRFRSVRRTARRLGDGRRLEDAIGNLMELECLAGSFGAASDFAEELFSIADERDDGRYKAEALLGKGYCSWQRGNVDEALRSMESVRAILTDETQSTEELRVKLLGLQCLVHLGRDQRDQAVAAGEDAMRLTVQRPTYWETIHGYIGPAEVFLTLLESGHPVPDGQARAAEALRRLKSYSGVFPIGRPRRATLEGRYRWLIGDRGGAFRSWRRGKTLAETLSMPFEEALARMELARHLDAGDEERSDHLAAAREILQRLEASRALADLEAIAASDRQEGRSS
jgi:tetratricopeptide (TPR) repeat protein